MLASRRMEVGRRSSLKEMLRVRAGNGRRGVLGYA